MMIRLGLIGFSAGNGHPYSWSAIINGYDPEVMKNCGFPIIPQYLERRSWPDDAIKGAVVSHVWTQDIELSHHVARAGRIANLVAHPEDMIGAIDGLLLARDDAETHYALAKPFLAAGLPIYIDKPICLSLEELDHIYALERYPGQIFTCSAVRYAPEMMLSEQDRAAIGPIREIHGVTPKDWDRYAVHVIEPMLALCGDVGGIREHAISAGRHGATQLTVRWESGLTTRTAAMGQGTKSPIALRLMGEFGYRDLVFGDSFTAFRAALQDFVDGIRQRDVRCDPSLVRQVVRVIELGREA